MESTGRSLMAPTNKVYLHFRSVGIHHNSGNNLTVHNKRRTYKKQGPAMKQKTNVQNDLELMVILRG